MPLPSDAKVFGIGLCRTGTKSLTRALNHLGVRTVHYPHDRRTYQELREGKFRLSVMEQYQGATDLPVVYCYAELDKAFPGSKFILTVREMSSWLRSTEQHWRRKRERFDNDTPTNKPHEREVAQFLAASVFGCHQFHSVRFSHVYQQHLRNVQHYFRNRPDDLLLLDICAGEAWERLCPFLGCVPPRADFPHVGRSTNKTSPMNKRQPSSTIWPLDVARRKHRQSERIAAALSEHLPRDQPVLDLGCGPGYYLKILSNSGFRCLGVEGTPGIAEIAEFSPIVQADLARPLELDWPKSTVICLEVAEHLRPEEESQLIETIDAYCSGRLIISWAIPGQRGTGHHNCRPNSYVYRRFEQRGFVLDPRATFLLRELAEDHVKYFRNTLLVMQRTAPHRASGDG
ncbi:MAG: sulfotransferase [Pirellulaceae bacterium]